jgi:cytochrome c-type biogenesis protein CcmE
MKHKARNRLIIALILFISASAGISIILYFLSDNIVFFITPSEISEKHLGQKIHIGGLVEKGSIEKYDSRTIIFTISDGKKSMKVKYSGILPGLFRESQGVVVEGFLVNISEIFEAKSLLTKHDENYKPPNKAGEK